MLKPVLQTLNKRVLDDFEYSLCYYRILLALSGIHLTDRELELLAFSGLKGNVYSPPIMDEFIEKFNSSKSSMYNIAGRLHALGIFDKVKGKMKVKSTYQLNTQADRLLLAITLDRQPEKPNNESGRQDKEAGSARS